MRERSFGSHASRKFASVNCDAFSFGSIVMAGMSRPQLVMISQAWTNLDLRPPLIVTSDWDPVATLKRLDYPAIVLIGQDYRADVVEETWKLHQSKRSKRILIFIGSKDGYIDKFLHDFDHVLPADCSILEIIRVLNIGMSSLNLIASESVANQAGIIISNSNSADDISEIREDSKRIAKQARDATRIGEKDKSMESAETFAGNIEEFGKRAAKLTGRQLDVLKLMARGATNKEIGRHLEVSPHTVGAHIGAILRTLNVTNRMKAVAVAEELGVLDN